MVEKAGEFRRRLRKMRERGKGEEVFEPDLFTRAAAVLKASGIDPEALMKVLEGECPDRTVERALERGEARKAPFVIPLFAFVEPEMYPRMERLLGRISGPYVRWAATLEDLLLSEPLHELNPAIPPKALSRYSFAFLYRFYMEKRKAEEVSRD